MKLRKLLPYCLILLCATTPLIGQTFTPNTPPAQTQQVTTPSNTPNATPSLRPEDQPSALRMLEEENAKEMKTEDTNNRFFMEFVNMLVTLGFILVLILIAGWFLKRLLNTRVQQMNTTSLIKILERRSLTPKSAIYLIEVAGKKIVIAETHSGITRIAEFPHESTAVVEEQPSFDKILQSKMKKE